MVRLDSSVEENDVTPSQPSSSAGPVSLYSLQGAAQAHASFKDVS